MGRPQTVFVDAELILAGIRTAYVEDLAGVDEWITEAEAAAKQHPKNFLHRRERTQAHHTREYILRYGIRCDIERFLGHAPTPTERLRVQKVIRDLEAAGRIVRTGRDILPVEQEDASPRRTEAQD